MANRTLPELYKDICLEKDLRQNLITLRSMLGDADVKRQFVYMLEGHFETFTALLHHDDPKVRKNAARILGEMETEDVLPFLFDAYTKEKTLFVRADYLRAMMTLDVRRYLKPLKEQREELINTERTEEERKHYRDELQVLDTLIARFEKSTGHTFALAEKEKKLSDVLVMTGPGRRDLTMQQIKTGTVKAMHSALRVTGADFEELSSIRTWQELLFPIPGVAVLHGKNPATIGARLAACGLAEYLDTMHSGSGAYRYRLDIRGMQENAEKGKLIRRITDVLDQESAGKLRNSVSDYEIEIRLLARKDGGYIPLLKMMTMPDKRFLYRKQFLADSISPVNAAAVIEAAKPYLTEGAQVLDPFCGAGIILTERLFALGASDTYGLDYRSEAIEKAKENTDRTGMLIHYVQRDFFSFTHSYLFEEIITDLPSKGYSSLETEAFYVRFFTEAYNLLKKGAVLVLHTSDARRVLACRGTGYNILKTYVINEKTQASVIVLKKI